MHAKRRRQTADNVLSERIEHVCQIDCCHNINALRGSADAFWRRVSWSTRVLAHQERVAGKTGLWNELIKVSYALNLVVALYSSHSTAREIEDADSYPTFDGGGRVRNIIRVLVYVMARLRLTNRKLFTFHRRIIGSCVNVSSRRHYRYSVAHIVSKLVMRCRLPRVLVLEIYTFDRTVFRPSNRGVTCKSRMRCFGLLRKHGFVRRSEYILTCTHIHCDKKVERERVKCTYV